MTNELIYKLELLTGKTFKNIEQVNKSLKQQVELLKLTDKADSELYQKRLKNVQATRDVIRKFNQEQRKTVVPTSLKELDQQLSKTGNNIEGLIEKQKLLQTAFNRADFDGNNYEELQKRLAAVNLELKKQRGSVKEAENALGGINPSVKFASGSFGELRQQIREAKNQLNTYTIGTKDFENQQQKLNALLQKEIDIRLLQPSLFKERIKQAINETEAVKGLRIVSANLRLEKDRLANAYKKNIEEAGALEKKLKILKEQGKENTDEFKDLTAEFRRLQKATKGVENDIDSVNKALSKNEKALEKATKSSNKGRVGFSSLKKSVLALGAVAGVAVGFDLLREAFVATVRVGAEFEQKIKDIQAVTGASSDQIRKLEENARALGGATQFTASQVAQFEKEQAKLGVPVQGILDSTSAILDAATATGEGLAETGQTITGTLNAFGKPFTDAEKLADQLTAAFSTSALDLEKFRESAKLASPVFAAQNISVEALTASLGKLADRQIDGSIAGTGLRRITIELGNENSKAAKAVGFAVKNTEDYVKALKILKSQNIDATRADELFGKNAISTALNLINAADSVETYVSSLENVEGAAKRAADIQRSSLIAQFNIFKSAVENLAISLTSLNSGALKDVIGGLTSFVNTINDYVKTPVSDVLRDQQAEFNALAIRLQRLNEEQTGYADTTNTYIDLENQRKRVIAELQEKYPEFIKNIKLEKVSNEELGSILDGVNDKLRRKIQLQEGTEALQKAQKEEKEAAQSSLNAQGKILEAVTLLEEKFGNINIDTSASQSIDDIFKSATQALSANRTDSALNLFSEEDAILRQLSGAYAQYARQSRNLASAQEEVAKQEEINLKLAKINAGVFEDAALNTKGYSQQLLDLKENLLQASNQLASLQKQGADPIQIEAAQLRVDDIQAQVDNVKTVLSDNRLKIAFQKLNIKDLDLESFLSRIKDADLVGQIRKAIAQEDFDLAQELLGKAKGSSSGSDSGSNGGDSTKKTVEQLISNINTQIDDALKFADFDKAESLISKFSRFGDKGKIAADKAIEKILNSRITNLNKEIDKALEFDDFIGAESFLNAFEKLGEEGAKALREAQEKILEARLSDVDTRQGLSDALLENERLINEQRIKEAQTTQTELLNITSGSGGGEFSSANEGTGTNIDEDPQVVAEKQRLEAFLQFNQERIDILTAAGKAENEETKEILNENLQAQVDFESFRAERIGDIRAESNATALGALQNQINKEADIYKRSVLELKKNQKEERQIFEENQKLSSENLVKNLAERQVTFEDAQKKLREKTVNSAREKRLREEEIEKNKTKFDAEQQKLRTDFQEKSQEERIRLSKKFVNETNQLETDNIVKKSELTIQGINASTDLLRSQFDLALQEQQNALQQQFLDGEISIREYRKRLEKLNDDAADGFIVVDSDALKAQIREQKDLFDRGVIDRSEFNRRIQKLEEDASKAFLQNLIQNNKAILNALQLEQKALEDSGTASQEEIDGVKQRITELQMVNANIQNAINNASIEDEGNKLNIFERLFGFKKGDDPQEIAGAIINGVNAVGNEIFNLIDLQAQTQLDAVDRQADAVNDRINTARQELDNLVSIYKSNTEDLSNAEKLAQQNALTAAREKLREEEKALVELDAKRKQLRKKEARRQKQKALFDIAINTAVETTKSLANPVLIPFIIALGAAQAVIVANQNFKSGGLISEEDIKEFEKGGAIQDRNPIPIPFAKGGTLSDGITVVEGGSIPNRKGFARGRDHTNGGIKAKTPSGNLIEMQGGEYNAVIGSGKKAVRMVFTRTNSPFLQSIMPKLENGGDINNRENRLRLLVGSFINQLSGGRSFFESIIPSPSFKLGGTISDKWTSLVQNAINNTPTTSRFLPPVPPFMIDRYLRFDEGGIISRGNEQQVREQNRLLREQMRLQQLQHTQVMEQMAVQNQILFDLVKANLQNNEKLDEQIENQNTENNLNRRDSF